MLPLSGFRAIKTQFNAWSIAAAQFT